MDVVGEAAEGGGIFWFIQGNIKVLMFCRVLWSFSTSIIYPFFSLYILALGGSSTEIGLISSLGLIAGMVLYPLGGYIADRAGRVKLIGYSTFLYAFAHLFFVFATNWQMIAIGQFFSQLLLFYMPAMNALESDSLPPGVRGKGFAIIMAVPGSVRIIAPEAPCWVKRSSNRFFISGVPYSLIAAEISCNPKMVIKLASARETSSTIIWKTDSGKFKPPYSQGSIAPIKSACLSAVRPSCVAAAYVT